LSKKILEHITRKLEHELGNIHHLTLVKYGIILLSKKFDYIFFLRIADDKCYMNGIYLGGIISDINGNQTAEKMHRVKKEIKEIVLNLNCQLIKLYI